VFITVLLLVVIPSPILFLRLSPSEDLLRVLEEGSVQLLVITPLLGAPLRRQVSGFDIGSRVDIN
jgi:hypothetical protein